MISVAPVYCKILRLFAAGNSLPARGFLNNDYCSAFAAQSLIKRQSAVSATRSYGSRESKIVVRFSTMSGSGGADRRHRIVEFRLSKWSVLKIQKGDITTWSVDGSSDAIVNPANELMLGGGGADGAIHQAAGPGLLSACYAVPEVRSGVRCPTGEARITPGFCLPASHVIHTVGPIYNMDKNPAASLRNAYRNSLRVAKENSIQHVAFTAMSCGIFGYPYDEAATVAISTVKEFSNGIKEFLLMLLRKKPVATFWGCLTGKSKLSYIKEVHFVLFSDEIYHVWLEKANALLQK